MVKLWSAFARCCVGHLDLEHDVRVCGGDGVCDAVAARRPWRADGEFQKWVCLLLLFNVVCVCVWMFDDKSGMWIGNVHTHLTVIY